MTHRPAGALEHEVLAVLAAADEPLTPAAVQHQLSTELAYTTVMTALTRLHDKGAVTREPAGRGYAYSFAADSATLTARRMRRLLDHAADRQKVLASFVAELGGDDAAVLTAILRDTKRRSA